MFSPAPESPLLVDIAITTAGSTNKIMSLFSNSNDIVIQWERIKCISDDLILVEI